jgi:predicted DNA-binding transcriptional regulator YafY
VLPASTRAHIQAVEQTVAFDSGSAASAPSGLAVLVLSSAIQSRRRVVLRYRSARGDLTEWAFDPYGIAYHRGYWYTIGYCHLRAGQRLFRLDRIAHIQMTNETFPQRVNFGALEAVSQALASVSVMRCVIDSRHPSRNSKARCRGRPVILPLVAQVLPLLAG